MTTFADQIIDLLGGSTAVSRLIEAPLSTVHSWRKNGIPPSRLNHLKLAAKDAGHAVDFDNLHASLAPADASSKSNKYEHPPAETGKEARISAEAQP